jgi:Xaa-Pro aminopeptidase
LARLRGRKSSAEVERIRRAVAVTEQVVDLLTPRVRPGPSERDLAAFAQARFADLGVTPAWAAEGCPIVNSGPASDLGHSHPSATIRVEPGHLVHVDLGVRRDGYCSDLQRMWYVRRPGETAPPADVQRTFDTVVRAIDAGAAALRPGMRGFEVDAAARQVVVDSGYPEFKHGLGHSLGRAVHDGGTMLGPRWPCYGRNPEGVVEAGNVFTLELGLPTTAGVVGLEEDVLVTADGCEFLSNRQRDLWLV